MENWPSEDLLRLIRETVDSAFALVSSDNTLLPFINSDPPAGSEGKGLMIALPQEGVAELMAAAREATGVLEGRGAPFAFVYQGFLTVNGVREAALFVEAKEPGEDKIHVFAQLYKPKRFLVPAKRLGNLSRLKNAPSQLRAI